MPESVAQQTLLDLKEDLKELDFLASGAGARLNHFRFRLRNHPSYVQEETRARLMTLALSLADSYKEIQKSLTYISYTETEIPTLIALKARAADQLRSLQGVTGSLLASADWQSPTFLSATQSQAGTQTGRIDGTYNDYKRDQHLDAFAYERAFQRAYIDAPLRFPPDAYVTSSGMAAFTTAVNTLRHDGKLEDGPILVGAGSYFENRGVLRRMFSAKGGSASGGEGRLHDVDELNAGAILAAVRELKPCAIFLDSLCNAESLAMPDLASLIPRLAKTVTRPTTLVLDNSGLAVGYQALKDLPLLHPKLRIVCLESLNKYYQFGMDRVTGGVVWTTGLSLINLFGTRMHLGTIMPDASVLSLPTPDRARLEKRLARFERNALFLANALNTHIKSKAESPVSHVVYPGLPSYKGYSWTKDRSFHGSSLVLAFKPGRGRTGLYKRFVTAAVSEASAAGVPLNAGTSFGLNVTRVYLTALHATRDTKPFVRISVGTETRDELDRLARILIGAVDCL